VAGFGPSVPSLISAIGDIVIERAPGEVVHLAIDALGTADKPVLVWTVVVISILIGAAIGVLARTNARAGVVGFGGFAVVGAIAGTYAALANPLFSLFAATAGAVAGLLALRLLLSAATAKPSEESIPAVVATHETPSTPDRRGFLQALAGAGFVAGATGFIGRALMSRSVAEASRSTVALPGRGSVSAGEQSAAALPGTTSEFDAVQGISSYITPNNEFYRIDTALLVPQVDASNWTMSINGMVDEPLELSLDDLLAEDLIDDTITIACVSNPVGGDLIGNAVWTGVPLARLLERAGVQPGATQVVGRSVDGWTAGFPTELALDGRPAMVAVGMNGKPLPVVHGFPARLIVPGIYGYVSATKWLREIELTTWEDFNGYWVPRGWSKLGPVKTHSRIDVPRGGYNAGPVQLGGVAWAMGRGIERVEVQIDNEDLWRPAQMGPAVSDLTWVQWSLDWEATSGTHLIAVRATDGEGQTQTAVPADVAPDGATGYHTIAVRV